ncbi:hypothetical protein EXIGLDRAFT_614563 [Exidia glandulosa HHB12029]|uniref:UbiA prenyltransferase n=1 Tax=Exidia glandulosa HHB12029 TaxID=1314781 RepID=A0A165HPA4_EXIGL|nr:hypothetical protein EXIGLDRAFT_614563 [Exidia glandulosa HHB12029]
MLYSSSPLHLRWTDWPQAWLGRAMNFGLPVTWAAVEETLDVPLISAFLLASRCLTFSKDTINACQDMKDVKFADVKSTALLFGSWIRPLALFATSFIASLVITGLWASGGSGFFVLSVCGTALHIAWQVAMAKLADPRSCWDTFTSNAKLRGLVWAGLATDYAVTSLNRTSTA